MDLADNFKEFVTMAKIAAYTHDLGKGIVSAYSRKKFDGDLDLQKKLPDHETILLGFIDPQVISRQHILTILQVMAFHHEPKHLSTILKQKARTRKRENIQNLEKFLTEIHSKSNGLTQLYENIEDQMVKTVQQGGFGYYLTSLVKLADVLAADLDRPVAYEEKTGGNVSSFGRSWNFSVKANPASYSPELMTTDFNSVIKEANEILMAAESAVGDQRFGNFFDKVRESSVLKRAPQGSHPPTLARSVLSHSLWMSVILQSLIYTSPEIRTYAASRQKGEDYLKLITQLFNHRRARALSPSIAIIIIDFSWLKTHLEIIKSSTALRGYEKFRTLTIQAIINCIKNEALSIPISEGTFDAPLYWEDNIVYQNPTQLWIALPDDSKLIEKALKAVKTNFSKELKKMADENVPDKPFPSINISMKVKRLLPANKTYKEWGREIVRTAWETNFEDLTFPDEKAASITNTCRHCGKPSLTEGDTCGICFYLTNLREKGKTAEEIHDENNNSMYLHGSITYAEPWLIGKSNKSIIGKFLKDAPHGRPYNEVQVKVKDNNVKFIRPTLVAFEEPQSYVAFAENMGSVFYLAKAYNWLNKASKLLPEKSQTSNLMKHLLDGDPALFSEEILPYIEKSYSNNGSGINEIYFQRLLEACLKEKNILSRHVMLSSMLTPLAFYVPSNIAEHNPDELKEAPSPTYLSDIYLLMEESTNRFINEIKKYLPYSRMIYSSPQEFLMLLPCKDSLINKVNGYVKSPVMEALKAFWKTANELPEECEIPDALINELPLTLNLVIVCGKYKLPVYLFMDKLKDEKMQLVNFYHLSSVHSKPVLFSPGELNELLEESMNLLDNEGGRALVLSASALYNSISKYMEEETALKITQEWTLRQLKRSGDLSQLLKSKPEFSRYITLNLSKLILLLRLMRTTEKTD